MSIQPALAPVCSGVGGAVELRVEPRTRDLGRFRVRRVLPSPDRKMVGPFVFLRPLPEDDRHEAR